MKIEATATHASRLEFIEARVKAIRNVAQSHPPDMVCQYRHPVLG